MTPPQATPPSARGLDTVAVQAVLRRLAKAPQPPWLHQEVARRMAERLSIIRLQPARIVDWWSHLGAGSTLLAQAYPQAQRLGVEPTAALMERSLGAARRPWWSPQRWQGAPSQVLAQEADIPAGQQLVWANMMLQMVDDPPALFERWHRLLAVDGFVMFSCPGPGTLRELRDLYQRLGWPAPTPAFIDMHDLGDMLVQAGFADPVMDQETLTLQWRQPEALLDELRLLGGNTAPQRFQGLRTPRWRGRLRDALAATRSADGTLSASFEIAYGHAFKAGPRVKAGEATAVSLEDMRTMVRRRSTKPLG
jgi:malonyl-CoA O-methyltransferase